MIISHKGYLLDRQTGFYPSTFLGPVTRPRNSIWDWVLILNLEFRINYLCIHDTIKQDFCRISFKSSLFPNIHLLLLIQFRVSNLWTVLHQDFWPHSSQPRAKPENTRGSPEIFATWRVFHIKTQSVQKNRPNFKCLDKSLTRYYDY